MGISKMQGVSAHLEFIKRKKVNINFVNCKFWNNEICYNNISIKYGEECSSKRGCLYSIPINVDNYSNGLEIINNESIKKQHSKKNQNINKENCSINQIINSYFMKGIKTQIEVENKYYKIETMHDKSNNNYVLIISYIGKIKSFKFKYIINLKDTICIKGNEVIFNIKLKDIIERAEQLNANLAKLIVQNNSNDIKRKAIVNNKDDIEKSRDSLVKYISYIFIRELIKMV